MIKIQIITLIFALLLSVTIVDLFYRPRVFAPSEEKRQFFVDAFESTHQCPLRGFRCPDDGKPCDCNRLCPNGKFQTFRVEADDVFVLDKKLEPGTYCLPEGYHTCNPKTEIPLYSHSGGWVCIARNRGVYGSDKQIACKNPFARNDDLNELVDRTTGQALVGSADVDFYERLPDGSMRYACRCDSVDMNGNRMVSPLPFVCSVDYCTRELRNVVNLGWRDGKCDCGPYAHRVKGDETSPCVGENTRIEKGILYGRVECTTRDAFERKGWWCPPPATKGYVTFEVRVSSGKNPTDFLVQHLDDLK